MVVELESQRWADVADSDDWDEMISFAAPHVGDAARAASPRPKRRSCSPRTSLESIRECHHSSICGEFRAEAPEFIPTQTMHCPLVGLCCAHDEVAEVPARRRRRRNGQALNPQPPQEWGVMPEASEETWEQRLLHRRKVLDTLQARVERLSQQHHGGSTPHKLIMEENTEHRNLESSTPRQLRTPSTQSRTSSEVTKEWVSCVPRPDPQDRTTSRRQWRKAVDEWFKASLMMAECHGSVVSTEECISTNCDADSDCSE